MQAAPEITRLFEAELAERGAEAASTSERVAEQLKAQPAQRHLLSRAEPDIRGSCDARFAAVAEALRENVAERGELGAAVAVVLDGRPVVDLWCGWSDAGRTRPWQRETIVNAFSVGKAFAALSLLMLVSRGAADLDDPVARHWPEFAAAGKEQVTLRQLLSHRAGLAAISRAAARGGALRLGAGDRRRSPPRSRGGRRGRATATTCTPSAFWSGSSSGASAASGSGRSSIARSPSGWACE